MKENKTLQFVWKGIGFGAQKGVFTYVYHDQYSFPYFLDSDEPYNQSRCYIFLRTQKIMKYGNIYVVEEYLKNLFITLLQYTKLTK